MGPAGPQTQASDLRGPRDRGLRRMVTSHARVQKALEGRGINIAPGNHLRRATDEEFVAAFGAGKNDVQIAREMNIDRGTVSKRRARLTARG